VIRAHPQRLGVVAAAAMCAFALAGCGTATVDNAQAEQIVRRAVNNSTSGAKLKKISCPSGVAVKTGTSFSCTLTVTLPNGSTHSGTVMLHIVDENGTPHLKASDSDYHLR
jgi:ABC-type uncharacterized transport system auxiliary subunit